MVSHFCNFANNSCNLTEVEPPGITNGKTLLLLSLVFVYVQFVHHRYVLIVYRKQQLKGTQNMAGASKNSKVSCCLFTENGARSSFRTDLQERRSSFVGST